MTDRTGYDDVTIFSDMKFSCAFYRCFNNINAWLPRRKVRQQRLNAASMNTFRAPPTQK